MKNVIVVALLLASINPSWGANSSPIYVGTSSDSVTKTGGNGIIFSATGTGPFTYTLPAATATIPSTDSPNFTTSILLSGVNALTYPTSDSTSQGTYCSGPYTCRYISGSSAAYHDVAIGYQVMQGTATTSFTGTGNVGIGYQAMLGNLNSSGGVAIGNQVANTATTGNGFVAIGSNALGSATTLSHQVGIGTNAALNVTNAENTAVGYEALKGSTGANFVTAVGSGALGAGTGSPFGVTAVGGSAGNNTTGNDNTYLGYAAGFTVTSGTNNTVIGYHVGSTTLTTGDNNLLIGTSTSVDTPASGTSNYMNIGGLITATGINTPATAVVTIKGVVGFPNESASTNHAVCWKASGVLGYCSVVVDASGVCGTCN